MQRLGVDVGGTFTDLVFLSDGQMTIEKVSSTPDDPARAIGEAVAQSGADLRAIEVFAHGTTVTTNAVVERSGARTGLLTTRGFRDVLQIRRTTRGELYNLQWDPPAELVPREWRFEVSERVDAVGQVRRAADLHEALEAVRVLLAEGVESIAVCFINAYLNGENERAVRAELGARFVDLPVFLSTEILPEWREFERTSTTVVSAYVGPVLRSYISKLESALTDLGYRFDLLIMLASGGLATAEAATNRPAHTIGSGPAAGVVAQLATAQASDLLGVRAGNVIGMDVGGTSTDISLIVDGSPVVRGEFELEFGTPVCHPSIDIGSIGAGGGTIAWVDPGGMLHVGPRSAGADPGPACMQRGGSEPTVTDANVVLHRLNPEHLLGGRLPVSEAAAQRAVDALAERLGLTRTRMAQGIVTLAVSHIVLAIRQRTVERGLDPRQFVLLAYGGAGPLFAADVAEQLGIPRVVVPRFPGVTSALGLLLTDIRHDFVATVLELLNDAAIPRVEAELAALEQRARARLLAEGITEPSIEMRHALDLRYIGQTHELTLELPRRYGRDTHAMLSELFGARHEQEFGHRPPADEPIEIVNIRLAGIGRLDRPQLPELAEVDGSVSPEPSITRNVYLGDTTGWVEAPVHERSQLGRGHHVVGPAIIDQVDSTTLIPPGWSGIVDRIGNLVLGDTG